MAYRVDTSILGRLANTADVQYPVAIRAVIELHRRGEALHVTPQNLVEFRNAATRPIARNGLGLTALETASRADIFEAAFPLLVETAAIYPAWKALVDAVSVIGKQVHDARLVACCHTHGISHLLTFNNGPFHASGGPRAGDRRRRPSQCPEPHAMSETPPPYFSPNNTNLAQLSAALAEKIWMKSRGRSGPMSRRRVCVPSAVDSPR